MKNIFTLILITLLSSAHGQGIPKYSIELIMPDSIDLIEPFEYEYKITALEDIADIDLWISNIDLVVKNEKGVFIKVINLKNVDEIIGLSCNRGRKPSPINKGESLTRKSNSTYPFITLNGKEKSFFMGNDFVEISVVCNGVVILTSPSKKIYVKPYQKKEDSKCAKWLINQLYPYLYPDNDTYFSLTSFSHTIKPFDYIVENYPNSRLASWATLYKVVGDNYFKNTDEKYPVLKHHSELDFSTAISKEDSFKVIRKNTWDYFMAEKSFVKENYQLDKVRANKKLILKYLPNACLKLKNKMRNIYEQLVNIEIKADYKDPEYNMAAFDTLYREYKDKNIEEW